MSAPFEERSGLVPCATPWGRWYQTMEEVFVEVNVPQGTRARDVECSLKSRHLALTVAGKEVLKEAENLAFCNPSRHKAEILQKEVLSAGPETSKSPLGRRQQIVTFPAGFPNEFLGKPVKTITNGDPTIGNLFDSTIADEATWTLEDQKLIRITLTKTNRDAGNCWSSLLKNEYAADPWVQDQMQRKLTLERFQRENPGFDFSGAEISGNYTKGGPDFSSLER